MKYLKKYLFVIICGVFFLIGAGLVAMGYKVNSENARGYQQVKSTYDKAVSLARQAVARSVIEQNKKIAAQISQNAKKVISLLISTTYRPLLSEKVFPKPIDESSQIIFYQQFADKYCQKIEDMIKQLNGGDRPSRLEEEKVIEEHRKRTGSARTGMSYLQGSGIRGLNMAQDTPEAQLIKDLRTTRAGSISIYVDPMSFCAYDYWKERPNYDQDTMMTQSWFTQLAAWIQEDVVASIAKLNDPAKNVLTNPVKRLIEITFSGDSVEMTNTRQGVSSNTRGKVVARRNPGSEKQLPAYVIRDTIKASSGRKSSTAASGTADDAPLKGNIVKPWTGRASDELIDIVQFEVGVIIDTSRMLDFVNALQSEKYDLDQSGRQVHQRNQITVLDMQLEPVDIMEENNGGYFYGSGALGVLRLTCEYFFYKEGYDKFKPEPIKQLFVQKEESQTGRGRRGAKKRR